MTNYYLQICVDEILKRDIWVKLSNGPDKK